VREANKREKESVQEQETSVDSSNGCLLIQKIYGGADHLNTQNLTTYPNWWGSFHRESLALPAQYCGPCFVLLSGHSQLCLRILPLVYIYRILAPPLSLIMASKCNRFIPVK